MAECGATQSELKASFGWTDTRTTAIYTKKFRRRGAATAASNRTPTAQGGPRSESRDPQVHGNTSKVEGKSPDWQPVGAEHNQAISRGLDCPTPENRAFDNVADFPQASNPEPPPENENPGALAGATGTNIKADSFNDISYRLRHERARTQYTARAKARQREIALRMELAADLASAIAEADPEDARSLMTAALIDLHVGMPPSEAIEAPKDEALAWARGAGEAELVATAEAVMAELQSRSLHSTQRRSLLRHLYLSLPLANRLRFLNWAKEAEA